MDDANRDPMSTEGKNQTTILAVSMIAIVAILAAIFLVIYKENQKTPAEKAGDAIGNAIEEVSDAVKDARN